MSNLQVAFDILDTNCYPPPGWSKVNGHINFDVRMTLERNSLWVKYGHITSESENLTYAGLVSQDSARIALTYSAMNGLDVFACDIQNSYLQSPSSKKQTIICFPEFGIENVGKKALIIHALY